MQDARGRPRIDIPVDTVLGLLNSRMTYKQIAEIFQVSYLVTFFRQTTWHGELGIVLAVLASDNSQQNA